MAAKKKVVAKKAISKKKTVSKTKTTKRTVAPGRKPTKLAAKTPPVQRRKAAPVQGLRTWRIRTLADLSQVPPDQFEKCIHWMVVGLRKMQRAGTPLAEYVYPEKGIVEYLTAQRADMEAGMTESVPEIQEDFVDDELPADELLSAVPPVNATLPKPPTGELPIGGTRMRKVALDAPDLIDRTDEQNQSVLDSILS